MKRFALVFVLFLFAGNVFAQKKVKPIIADQNFYKQNDIWEAIGFGVLNFEADLMYIYGRNYVTHSMPDSIDHQFPTFVNSYLYPLFNQFKKNKGEIYPGCKSEIFLIVNFVSTPLQVYNKLISDLAPFKEMISYQKDGNMLQGKLRILINNPDFYDKLKSKQNTYFGLVGKVEDLEKNIDSELMPLIELDFTKITSWNGAGNIPYEDFVKLKNLVNKVHEQEKKLCIFNCPDEKSLIELFNKTHVDFIKVQNFRDFADKFDSIKD